MTLGIIGVWLLAVATIGVKAWRKRNRRREADLLKRHAQTNYKSLNYCEPEEWWVK